MSLLTMEEVKELAQNNLAEPCVSIFMPTHRAGPETRQDPIRLKNLVIEAEERLISGGLRSPTARGLLKPAQALVDDYDFWQHQQDGLTVFLSPDFFRTYRLPLEFEETLEVGHRFYLKPLLPLLGSEEQFYLLALSQNEIRLFEGRRDSIEQIQLDDLPGSLAETLRFDEPLKQQQFHTATATPGSVGKRPAMFHGQGVGKDESKNNLLRFFQQLDRGLREYLNDSRAPLILAGVEYLIPIYREANSYPHLLRQGVTGNPETMSAAELHQRAWPLVQAHFDQEQYQAAARYNQLAGTNQVTNDLTRIVPAAHYGQIDTLFVASGVRHWGRFDPENNILHIHPVATPSSDDIVDLTAIQTLLQGGTVYVVPPNEVPEGASLAAIFRYQV